MQATVLAGIGKIENLEELALSCSILHCYGSRSLGPRSVDSQFQWSIRIPGDPTGL